MTLKLLAGIFVCLALCTSAFAGDGKARQRGAEAMKAGDYPAAEKHYREALEKDSHDTEARLGLSFALLKQRMLQDAYDHAARVILSDPRLRNSCIR
jgi:tetratricopeptide (TPR) repeat protein